ncbi:sel1 repeat family protein [Allocoprobacillus halotolerans]|uniref:Sel1 repeat family protein n=1 Tax=Allocoprobacillus halotolerans TaxID=2944914 RepID=A0ABY5I3A7_9FIRM|nr:tetratricopeptide repeat protein [Allocoprobacillus halotolerans]UTY39852.1 sel1 repeat family protein [Allocoprobacillus halotolerans]
MNIQIIEKVVDVFNHYGDVLRFQIERFEEVLNDAAFDMMDECYLVVLGMKLGVFEAMIFDEDFEISRYVTYLCEYASLKEEEALFMVSVYSQIIETIGYYFEIPDVEQFLKNAYQHNQFSHLYVLARTYFLGFGVTQDYEKAFEIFSYLYQQGVLESCYYIGYMYEHGYGIEQDILQAFHYYQTNVDSQSALRLGLFYMYGYYVEVDEEKAMYYFLQSQEKEAYLYQGLLLESQKDYSAAFQAYLKGAKSFQKECLYKVGMLLKRGIGVELNLNEALHYFTYGYYLLQEDCTYELSMLSFDGVVVKKDEKQALEYLHQAARLKSYDACLLLSQFYEWGRYVQKNHQYALSYYQQAQVIKEEKENQYEII